MCCRGCIAHRDRAREGVAKERRAVSPTSSSLAMASLDLPSGTASTPAVVVTEGLGGGERGRWRGASGAPCLPEAPL
mgnify:CR=1 FL=1